MKQDVFRPFGYAPAGAIDGANCGFRLRGQPVPNSWSFYKNGLFQTPGLDYVQLGEDITCLTAPQPGDKLYAQGS